LPHSAQHVRPHHNGHMSGYRRAWPNVCIPVTPRRPGTTLTVAFGIAW
jgi:hypothetical protein